MAESNFAATSPSLESSIISSASAEAATAAFAKLNHAAETTAMPSSGGQLWVGARTIEQVVEDLMRPMLRQWLDQNLPRLVERLVEKELSRMARRAGD
jgi:cell pole-organizing protein PopZ